MTFFFFFSFSLACLTHLLNFALNQKLTLEAWGSKLINELWQGMWARPTCCFTPNTIGLSTKFNYHKEFKFNDWIIKMRIDIKIHIVNWNSSWFRCKLCISVSFSLPFCGPFCPLVVILLSFVVVFSTSFVVAPVAVQGVSPYYTLQSVQTSKAWNSIRNNQIKKKKKMKKRRRKKVKEKVKVVIVFIQLHLLQDISLQSLSSLLQSHKQEMDKKWFKVTNINHSTSIATLYCCPQQLQP